MNSKTSLFSKSIIKSDIKRFWWVSVVYIIFIMIVLTSRFIGFDWDTHPMLSDYISDEGMMAFFTAFFTGVMLFSYLNNSKSAAALHGIPVKRKTLYFSHYLSGIIVNAIPIVIISVVLFVVYKYHGWSGIYAFKYMYTAMVYTILMLSLTSCCAMVSGNTIASYVFTGGIIILPLYLAEMWEMLLSRNLYGYSSNRAMVDFVNQLYIMGIDNMWSKSSLLYILLAVVLAVVALWLYKIRGIERSGEIVAFKPLKYAFMAVTTLCLGMWGYAILNVPSVWAIFPLGYVALAATNMLNNKSLSFKGMLKPTIAFAAVLLMLDVSFRIDVTGFEKRVPDLDDVAQIKISQISHGVWDYSTLDDKVDYNAIDEYLSKVQQKDMDKVISLHQAIVDKSDESTSINIAMNFSIEYDLKNGSRIARAYYIDASKYDAYVKNYVESDTYKDYKFLKGLPKDANNIKYVDYYSSNTSENVIQLKDINYQDLINAVKSDINNLDYKGLICYAEDNNSIRKINIITTGKINNIDCTYNIHIPVDDNFPVTKSLVEAELSKYKDVDIRPENITGVAIDGNIGNINVSGKDAVDIFNFAYNYTIDTNKYWSEEVKRYSLTFDYKDRNGNGSSIYFYVMVPESDVPDVIKKYSDGGTYAVPVDTEIAFPK